MKKFIIILSASLLFFSLMSLLINHIYVESNNNMEVNEEKFDNSGTTKNQTAENQMLSNNKLSQKDSYTIIIVGDSMVDALGSNLDHIRTGLKNHYPDKTFGLFNYGYSSTNITTLMDRLTTETEYKGQKKPPILSREFDILIIESFGHNPLSQETLPDGLLLQEQILNDVVTRIRSGHPNSVIIFLAMIGAHKVNYAKGVFDLNQEQRTHWADERNAYIENHISFAIKNNIPLINIYENTLVDGTVDPKFINEDSWIHPSDTGVRYISQQIADYLYDEKIIPVD